MITPHRLFELAGIPIPYALGDDEEYLAELFGSAAGKWEWGGFDEWSAIARFTVDGVEYEFDAETENGRTWGLSFARVQPRLKSGRRYSDTDAEAYNNSRYGLSGTGNSAEVMTIVSDIIRSFIQKLGPSLHSLVFSAKEPSRQRLYERVVARLLPHWQVVKGDAGETRTFVVVNPEYRAQQQETK